MRGASSSGKFAAAAGNTRATRGPGLTIYGSVPPPGSVTELLIFTDPAGTVSPIAPAGNIAEKARASEEILSFFDSAINGKTAEAELMLRLESSAARAATINPPPTDRKGSLSAAVPTLCQASVPLK